MSHDASCDLSPSLSPSLSLSQAIYGGTDPLTVDPINGMFTSSLIDSVSLILIGSLVSLADQSHYVIEAYNNM